MQRRVRNRRQYCCRHHQYGHLPSSRGRRGDRKRDRGQRRLWAVELNRRDRLRPEHIGQQHRAGFRRLSAAPQCLRPGVPMTAKRNMRPQRRRAIFAILAGAVLLLAGPALAVDGEILISQGKVNAGGITPGDTAGFPATLSKPGHYKLSGNLSAPAQQNAIEVTTADVTIDLNGFTISSATPSQAASGIVALVGGGLLRVMNGTITGFSGSGVDKSPGRAVIENMRLLA